jgi:hypothetical protein
MIQRAETETRRRLGVARGAAAELATGRLELAPSSRPMDGTVDTAATGEMFIGRVDHRVDVQIGDVALQRFDPHALEVT